MSRVKSLSLSGIVLLLLLGCVLFSNSKALTTPVDQSPQSDNTQAMQALVNEVRQLRLAIQRSDLNTYHAQVTLERLRLQQQRVDRLSEKLETVRTKISETKSHQANLKDQIEQMEEAIAKVPDPNRRRELERDLRNWKRGLEQILQQESQAREEEARLTGQLQIEQANLNELNERLDELQKELEVVDKPLPSGKRQ